MDARGETMIVCHLIDGHILSGNHAEMVSNAATMLVSEIA
jgi:hypothetical protein